MRTLNRPMFKYGGPIKEGVMSGIREPHRNGQRVGLYNVGSPGQFKKTGGREHHYVQALAAIPWFLRAASIPFGRWATTQAAKKGVTSAGGNLIRSGLGRTRTMRPGENYLNTLTQTKNKFTPHKFWSQDPLYKAGATGVGWAGKGIRKGGQFAKYATTTPSGLAFFGAPVAYMGGKYLLGDGTELNKDQINQITQTGKKPWESNEGMKGDGSFFAAEAEKEAGIAKQKAFNKRIQKYRDIMDIKGMNKDAAYKSLIDASKLINESQDFKGDIRSGKLINQVIQAASKQFEKPAKTRDAIDTLILKGEIEKDIKASDPSNAVLNELRGLQGKKLLKELNPSKSDLVAVYAKAGVKGQSLYDNAAKELSANKGEVFRGNLIPKSDFTEILAELKKNPEIKNADDVTIIATWTQNELNNSQKNIPDGNYTVGSTIVTIKDKQVVDVK